MQTQLLVLFALVLLHADAIEKCQGPESFLCKDGQCISNFHRCDGTHDCKDGSDETDCSTSSSKFADQCKPNEFACHDNLHCIPFEDYCDNKPDCIDGSDELENCHLNKTECNQFKCANNHCVSKSWVCDGVDDCKDNSDELNCDTRPILPANCNNTIGKYLCSNKRCISLPLVCNGNNDCGDDSDENPAECVKAQQICNTSHPCQHKCSPTPKGFICSCNEGYKLGDEGKCSDINECLEYGKCAQGCRNTDGSYYCVCEVGYKLQDDGRNCKAMDGEALMIFASKSSIRGYYLDSKVNFTVAENLQHAVGVSLDSNYVYWSDIQLGDEAIVRSHILHDGGKREVIVSAGLGCPENIAIDWIAGNLYFIDSLYKHIGVCSDDGNFCTVIIKQKMKKPRGIVLMPLDGKLYWSDWSEKPHISVADMDGSNNKFFVKDKILWPNGLTIDYPSRRLYWVDAKSHVIESIRLDGTDRQVVFKNHEIIINPYSIAIFENQVYWSDWITNSIHSCDKFTGKGYKTLFMEKEPVYGIHIYHSTLKAKDRNPCNTKPCSHLCLLTPNRLYSCACPLDMELNEDRHSCKDTVKRKIIAIAARNKIINYYHELLGRPRINVSDTDDHITAMTYDSLADTLIAADEKRKTIFRLNYHTGTTNHIIKYDHEVVESLAFDYLGNNIYRSNPPQKAIKIYSLTTGETTELSFRESPYDLVVVPEEGIIFIVFRASNEFHIDKVQMNGLGSRTHLIEHGLLGPKISLAYDHVVKRIYWADDGTGRIESVDIEGQNRILFQTGIESPVSLVVLDNEVFWTSRKSNRLSWADKHQVVAGIKGFNLQNQTYSNMLYLQMITGTYIETTHPCRKNNGDCSHICLVIDSNKRLCACPTNLIINADLKTCGTKTTCSKDEFECTHIKGTCSGDELMCQKCIKNIQRCNGVNDCPDGSDEQGCGNEDSSCHEDEFACRNGTCIKKTQRCDSIFNCEDHSDEENCDINTCNADDSFRCSDDKCIKKSLVCNGVFDCDDYSDESGCHACGESSFACHSGLCIPRNWECDGQRDCEDGSDEHETCTPTECGENMFSCKNGRCIDVLLKCDNENDCEDNSDEANCPENTKTEALICTKYQYRCQNSTICIGASMRCNGIEDCPQRDDEEACDSCYGEQFTCKNSKCIPHEWVCDESNDCGDNSDEQQCDAKMHTLSISGPRPGSNCSDGEFPCLSGRCLPLSKFCDGEKHCYDGSDEGGECEKACVVNTCENVCHKTPTGPVCSCRDGYKLSADGNTCEDVDECQKNICSQHCTNRPGSFFCSCFEGFALRFNHISCKATGPVMKLITATKDDIRIMSPMSPSNSLTILHRNPSVEITGLDVNARENTIYWSNEVIGAINKMNIDTKKVTTLISGVGSPETLAVDWITDNVYFYDNRQKTSIKACDMDASKCSTIVQIDDFNERVTAIALEPLKEMLFWSPVKWKLFKAPEGEIRRADLTGADSKPIVRENIGVVSGLTIDYHRSLLYWSDNYHTSIECADFNGNNRKAILADLITKPFGLNFYEDSLYWGSDSLPKSIRKHQLYGSKIDSIVPVGQHNIEKFFVLSQISRQPAGPNECKNRGCKHMCIMHIGKPTCICSNGFPATAEGGTVCVDEDTIGDELTVGDENFMREESPVLTHIHRPQSGNQSTRAFTGLAVTLVAFAIMFSVYFYLKKKRPGLFKHRDLSIHFQNPSFARRRNNNSSMTSTTSILMPGEHEYSNPITDMSHPKLNNTNSGSKKRLELTAELSDGELEEASTNHRSRLIH